MGLRSRSINTFHLPASGLSLLSALLGFVSLAPARACDVRPRYLEVSGSAFTQHYDLTVVRECLATLNITPRLLRERRAQAQLDMAETVKRWEDAHRHLDPIRFTRERARIAGELLNAVNQAIDAERNATFVVSADPRGDRVCIEPARDLRLGSSTCARAIHPPLEILGASALTLKVESLTSGTIRVSSPDGGEVELRPSRGDRGTSQLEVRVAGMNGVRGTIPLGGRTCRPDELTDSYQSSRGRLVMNDDYIADPSCPTGFRRGRPLPPASPEGEVRGVSSEHKQGPRNRRP